MAFRERLLVGFVFFATFFVTLAIISVHSNKKIVDLQRVQQLWCDGTGCVPSAYDASFGTAPEDYDGSEDAVMFNGADAEGASWRGLVPVAVWPERTWFDSDGTFTGVAGGRDKGRTTVTR